jgi:hypothetical protein
MNKAITDLRQAVQDMRKTIRRIPEESCLDSMGEWSPRDILAHLIGWNRYTITACRKIRMGELPLKLAGNEGDYGIVDPDSVRLYNSTDCEMLLDEIETSYQSLENFLLFMKPEDWDKDFGVQTGEETLTIENVVRALIKNYQHHLKQLVSWENDLKSQ